MPKALLHHLCLLRCWPPPEYVVVRGGSDHNPLFIACVTVDGAAFFSPDLSGTKKSAEMSAAEAAFDKLVNGRISCRKPKQVEDATAKENYSFLFKKLLQELEELGMQNHTARIIGNSASAAEIGDILSVGDAAPKISAQQVDEVINNTGSVNLAVTITNKIMVNGNGQPQRKLDPKIQKRRSMQKTIALKRQMVKMAVRD